MKKLFTLLMLPFAGFVAQAQCSSGCTTIVNSASSTNYYIGPGQKLCIAPSGTVTGLIAVSGGTLCNQGTINTSNVLINGAGRFENYGYGNIDSLLVTGTNTSFINYGNLVHQRMSTTNHALSNNLGTINTDYLGDSLGTYVNNNNLIIHNSIYNGYNSLFYNLGGYVAINSDFFNSTNSYFYTDCMISVGHDWYNSATIANSGSTCGGFHIANGSYNSGTVTASGGGIDLCDAGNSSHIDANTGTIASGVTFCTCNHACTTVASVEEYANTKTMSLYPNPSNGIVHLRYSEAPQMVDIYNATGQLVMSVKNESLQAGEMLLHTESLPGGIYLITAKSKGTIVYSSRFMKD